MSRCSSCLTVSAMAGVSEHRAVTLRCDTPGTTSSTKTVLSHCNVRHSAHAHSERHLACALHSRSEDGQDGGAAYRRLGEQAAPRLRSLYRALRARGTLSNPWVHTGANRCKALHYVALRLAGTAATRTGYAL